MAISFFSLLLMGAVAVQQTGFLLVFAVLFDTFVVRSLLVPAIMSVADSIGTLVCSYVRSARACVRPCVGACACVHACVPACLRAYVPMHVRALVRVPWPKSTKCCRESEL